ncbi:hypothetical protein ACHQM5_015991 [Ranunculus cassubicifolius]
MEFYGYAFANSATSSSSSSCLLCLESFRQLTVQEVFGNLLSAVVSLVFAIVGPLFGAITGLKTVSQESSNSGYLRGAAVGAVSGILLPIEVFESFRRLWLSDSKRIQCLQYLTDVLASLVSGRLVRERVGPLLLNPTERGTSEPTFLVENIPLIQITTKNHFDSCGEENSCSVCLEDLKVGQKVRDLPYCRHMFHPNCIDQWLTKHGSCPLCRRNL